MNDELKAYFIIQAKLAAAFNFFKICFCRFSSELVRRFFGCT